MLRQYQPSSPWRLVVIYPHRSVERIPTPQFAQMLNQLEVTRIYLDELEASPENLGVEVLRLMMASEAEVTEKVPGLIREARRQLTDNRVQQNFLDLIEIIVVYKLPSLSREAIAAMFSLEELKQTRFYQEVKAEGKAEGRIEGKAEGRIEGEINLLWRQLTRKLSVIPPELESQIRELSSPQLEDLAEALLDFQSLDDLQSWLQQVSPAN